MNLNNKPLVTAVIPSYNHKKYIKESIQSMIDQDYENIEMIIIDDGSSDNSVEIIKEMIPSCKKRFKRFEFRHRSNKGISATLNEAINWAKGKYLSPLASDDIALSNKTSFLVDKLESSGHKAAFGSVVNILDENNIYGAKEEEIFYTFNELFLLKKIIHGTASVISIESIKKVGLYNENIAIEDLYMWLKLTEDGSNLICYPKILAKYRTHDNNTTKYIDIMYKNLSTIINLFKDNQYYKEALRASKIITLKQIINLNNNHILTDRSSLVLYDNIIKQTIECNNTYKQIVVYGYGSIAKIIKDYLNNNVVFFDIQAGTIDSKDKILDINEIKYYLFDKIIISALGHEKEIIKILTKNYKIDMNKIYVFNL